MTTPKLPKVVEDAYAANAEHVSNLALAWDCRGTKPKYDNASEDAVTREGVREIVSALLRETEPLVTATRKYLAFPCSEYRAELRKHLTRYDELRKETRR